MSGFPRLRARTIADLDPTLSTRDPEATRRTVQRNDTLPALSLFARPDEESRWTQIETAE